MFFIQYSSRCIYIYPLIILLNCIHTFHYLVIITSKLTIALHRLLSQQMSYSALQDGVTALLMASQNGYEEVVRLLLQSGAQDLPDNVRNLGLDE